MKIILFLLPALLLFYACESSKKLNETTKIIARLGQENSCTLFTKAMIGTSGSSVEITPDCNSKDLFFSTKILYDVFLALREKNIHYDTYSFTSKKGEGFTITKTQMQTIEKKISYFDRYLLLELKNGNTKSFIGDLSDNLKRQNGIAALDSMATAIVFPKDMAFYRFGLLKEGATFYVQLNAVSTDRHIFHVTFKLDANDKRIYGFGDN